MRTNLTSELCMYALEHLGDSNKKQRLSYLKILHIPSVLKYKSIFFSL